MFYIFRLGLERFMILDLKFDELSPVICKRMNQNKISMRRKKYLK